MNSLSWLSSSDRTSQLGLELLVKFSCTVERRLTERQLIIIGTQNEARVYSATSPMLTLFTF